MEKKFRITLEIKVENENEENDLRFEDTQNELTYLIWKHFDFEEVHFIKYMII